MIRTSHMIVRESFGRNSSLLPNKNSLLINFGFPKPFENPDPSRSRCLKFKTSPEAETIANLNFVVKLKSGADFSLRKMLRLPSSSSVQPFG